jgi:hypothetical protein
LSALGTNRTNQACRWMYVDGGEADRAFWTVNRKDITCLHAVVF